MSNDGKSAEAHIKEALDHLERTRKSTYLRLYDSRSAGLGRGGNVIPPQPADFVFVLDGTTALLEVKSSEKHRSLRDATLKSVFSDVQMLGAKLWPRAGCFALCAFYSIEADEFEIWDSTVIREAYYAPARQRKLQGEPLASCDSGVILLVNSLAVAITAVEYKTRFTRLHK